MTQPPSQGAPPPPLTEERDTTDGATVSPQNPTAMLAVLAFAGLGASFMQTILIPIQGQLPQLLHTTSESAAWTITATLVSAAICTPVAGRLGDMFGKRRIAIALLVLQTVGAILAAISTDVVTMIVARILQGMAAGVIPLGIALLRGALPPRRLGSGIALISATLGVGGALGLPVSAIVAEHSDWHTLFWVAAAFAVLSVVGYVIFVPPDAPRESGRIDVAGIIGLSLGLIGVLIAISRGGEWGWVDARTLTFLIGGVAVLLIWGALERRVKNPLVDLRVNARPSVLLTNLASVAMGFALFASNVVLPQLLVLPRETGIGLGMTLTVAALILAPAGVMMMAVAPVAGWVQRRWGAKQLLILGAAVLAAAYGLALGFHAEAWQILVVNVVLGVGVGLGYAAMPALIMQAVPAEEAGAANGLNALMRSLGTSAAAAVAGAVLANSITTVGAVTGPSESGFVLTLTLGLGAAITCVVVAAFIPHRS